MGTKMSVGKLLWVIPVVLGQTVFQEELICSKFNLKDCKDYNTVKIEHDGFHRNISFEFKTKVIDTLYVESSIRTPDFKIMIERPDGDFHQYFTPPNNCYFGMSNSGWNSQLYISHIGHVTGNFHFATQDVWIFPLEFENYLAVESSNIQSMSNILTDGKFTSSVLNIDIDYEYFEFKQKSPRLCIDEIETILFFANGTSICRKIGQITIRISPKDPWSADPKNNLTASLNLHPNGVILFSGKKFPIGQHGFSLNNNAIISMADTENIQIKASRIRKLWENK